MISRQGGEKEFQERSSGGVFFWQLRVWVIGGLKKPAWDFCGCDFSRAWESRIIGYYSRVVLIKRFCICSSIVALFKAQIRNSHVPACSSVVPSIPVCSRKPSLRLSLQCKLSRLRHSKILKYGLGTGNLYKIYLSAMVLSTFHPEDLPSHLLQTRSLHRQLSHDR